MIIVTIPGMGHRFIWRGTMAKLAELGGLSEADLILGLATGARRVDMPQGYVVTWEGSK